MEDEHLSKHEFLTHIGYVREDIQKIEDLQREQNGRVGRAETRIAVLEERTPPSRTETNVVSAFVSAAIAGIGMYFSNK